MTVKIASAGAWHTHAKDFANRIKTIPIPGCKLDAVFDFDPEKAKQWAEEKDCRCFTDYEELIHDPEIDGIMVTCQATRHAELLIRAVEAGKNVYVEKSLATTREDALRIKEAVHKAEEKFGIHFVMSDPVQKGPVLYAKKLMDEGKFGKVLLVRSRNLHNFALTDPELVKCYQTPEESGGGVMLDMGHHSVHAINFLLGRPVSVTGTFQSVNDYAKSTGVDDFATMSFQYADGAIGIAEGSLVTGKYAGGLEVVGTNGYLLYNPLTGVHCAFEGEEPYTVPDSELPKGWMSPQVYWVECIRENKPCEMYGVDEACEITEMICAGYESKGREVKV